MKHVLGIYNSTNKRFRHDGDEFKREAWKWASAQPDIVKPVDVQDGRVRREILAMNTGLDVLAFFDYGTPKGLPRMRENLGNVKGLARTIAGVTRKITIILYACSCGRGWWGRWGFRWKNRRNKEDCKAMTDSCSPRNGYAMILCAELEKLGVESTVFAHLTRGHTTHNPHVVLSYQLFNIKVVVRRRCERPGDPYWKKWKRDLKGPLRFTFWH